MKSNLLKVAKKINSHPLFIKNNIVTKKELSYKYLKYRFLRPLLKGYFRVFRFIQGQCPWTSPASIMFFKKALTKDMIGFEYGSGASTYFFAKRLNNLVSLEHDSLWYEKVKRQLKKSIITNVEYHLVPKDKNGKLNTYADFITKFDDEYFDFVLIDGRERVRCATNAIPKLKTGGILVIDNAERARYANIKNLLEKWPQVNTTMGLTDTTIYFKP